MVKPGIRLGQHRTRDQYGRGYVGVENQKSLQNLEVYKVPNSFGVSVPLQEDSMPGPFHLHSSSVLCDQRHRGEAYVSTAQRHSEIRAWGGPALRYYTDGAWQTYIVLSKVDTNQNGLKKNTHTHTRSLAWKNVKDSANAFSREQHKFSTPLALAGTHWVRLSFPPIGGEICQDQLFNLLRVPAVAPSLVRQSVFGFFLLRG